MKVHGPKPLEEECSKSSLTAQDSYVYSIEAMNHVSIFNNQSLRASNYEGLVQTEEPAGDVIACSHCSKCLLC